MTNERILRLKRAAGEEQEILANSPVRELTVFDFYVFLAPVVRELASGNSRGQRMAAGVKPNLGREIKVAGIVLARADMQSDAKLNRIVRNLAALPKVKTVEWSIVGS